MATEHPQWVHAAIKALAQSDVNAAEIRRRLGRGAIPGKPAYSIPLRTVQQYAQRARQQLEPIGDDDVATANAIERSALRIARAEMHRLELKQRKGGITTGEAQAMRAHAATVRDIKRERQRGADPVPDPEAQERQRQSTEAQRAAPANLLDRIARDMEQNGAQADADPAST